MLAAMIDNRLMAATRSTIDATSINWKRVVDIEDSRAAQKIIVGLAATQARRYARNGLDIAVPAKSLAMHGDEDIAAKICATPPGKESDRLQQ